MFRRIAVPVGAYDTCWTALAANRLRIGFLSVYQGEERGPFPLESVERMAVLGPHLVRAARIHAQFGELRERAEVLQAALDEVSFGLITCTDEARVVTLNRSAEQMLGPRGPLRLSSQRLSGRTPHETNRLRELIGLASSTAVGEGSAGGGVVALSGPSDGAPPLAATVAPLSKRIQMRFDHGVHTSDAPLTATALVVVTNPEQALNVPEGALRELYGLTPAEARVALAIARGQSLSDYAEEAGIRIGTARWTLKKVQAKTGTDRQGALASLVLRSLGPLAHVA